MNMSDTKNTIREFYGKRTKLLFIYCIVVILLLFIVNPRIDRDVLFWFMSSISQSMAAMFAVVGMFAVFRYESINEKIIKELDVIKHNLDAVEASGFAQCLSYMGIVEEGMLENLLSELDSERGQMFEEKEPRLHSNLTVTAKVCKHSTRVRDSVYEFARIPMTLMLCIFFIASLSLLIINSYFGKAGSFNYFGAAIVALILISMIITIVSITIFFLISFSDRRNK